MKKLLLLTSILLLTNLVLAQKKIKISTKNTKNGYEIVGVNNTNAPYLIRFVIQESYNLSGGPGNNQDTELSPGKHTMYRLRVINVKTRPKLRYQYSYRMGAKVNESKLKKDLTYLLPIKSGNLTKVGKLTFLSDIYGKKKGTNKPKDFYAIYFTMEEGDSIYAARGGTVIELKKDLAKIGEGLRFKEDINFVKILHKDGTIASYRLFAQNEIQVKAGQKVVAGEVLGKVGSSNYEMGTHMRFSIYYADKESGYTYLKPHFLSKENESALLEMKEIYTAAHSEEVIIQEMNKRQRKRRAKNKMIGN